MKARTANLITCFHTLLYLCQWSYICMDHLATQVWITVWTTVKKTVQREFVHLSGQACNIHACWGPHAHLHNKLFLLWWLCLIICLYSKWKYRVRSCRAYNWFSFMFYSCGLYPCSSITIDWCCAMSFLNCVSVATNCGGYRDGHMQGVVLCVCYFLCM